MPNTHTRGDWKRLGTAVQAARLRRKDAGLDRTAEWADAIGRSSRVLLGLERGEPVGAKTLRKIEEVLHWPTGYCNVILDDPSADPAPDEAKPLQEDLVFEPPPRALDEYRTADLLQELENRFVEMALELHRLGAPAATSRLEDFGTVIEAMSPAERRKFKKRGGQVVELPAPQPQPGDTGGETRE